MTPHSFLLSGICAVLPYVSELSSGIRTILLTLLISAVAAWRGWGLFPVAILCCVVVFLVGCI